MINAKAMENSGIQVMHMDPILCGKVPELISGTMNMAWPNSSACHPHTETMRVMIPSVTVP